MIGGSYAMGEVIVVTSGKGGVGKTTTTANVGTGLAAAGRKVVLIDTDLGLRNLDVIPVCTFCQPRRQGTKALSTKAR